MRTGGRSATFGPMTHTVPAHRRAPVQEVLQALGGAKNVVLTTHLNADGDGVGSELALAAWLRDRGTDAWIVNPTPFPDSFRFLVPDPAWILPAGSEAARERCGEADLAVVLDTGEVSRIGRVKPLIDGIETVIVDHHPAGEHPILGLGFRDAGACATGELVFELIQTAGGPWLPVAVDGLYVALLTDTGSFRHSNSTAACHRIVAELLERGADPAALYRKVYGAFPLRRLQLLRAALECLAVSDDGTVAWMTVPDEDFRRLGSSPEDLDGFVDYPRSVDGVEVALLFRKIGGGATKVSFRSNGDVDVNALARNFGGGGHVKAAGAVIKGTPAAVRETVVEAALAAVQAVRGGVPVPVAEEPDLPE